MWFLRKKLWKDVCVRKIATGAVSDSELKELCNKNLTGAVSESELKELCNKNHTGAAG